jgi:transposase
MRRISVIYDVSISSISRWTRDIKIKDLHQKRKSKFTVVSSYLKELVDLNPLLTLKALKKKIEQSFNLKISIGRIWIYLQLLKFSNKKVRKVTICDKNTKEIKDILINRINEKKRETVYALDEVGFRLEMYPNRGWSKKGTRCNYSSCIKSHKNVNAIFMISSQGVVSYKLHNKAIKGDTFLEFLNTLDPNTLNGKTIVMDNLRVHHMIAIKD